MRHLPVDLGNLAGRALPEIRGAVPVLARLQQVGDLLQGEPEPLRVLDDTDQRDRVRRIGAMPADAARGCPDQATPFVVAQRLDVDPGLFGDLTGLHGVTPA